MKSVFDRLTRDQLISRIKQLDENSMRQWGTMNVYQMLKHCTLAEEMYLGEKTYKRVLLGRILGKIALNSLLKNEAPMGRNAPTSSYFKVSEINGNIAAEKANWIALLQQYESFDKPGFVHWFFGSMTKEQIGYLVYKHADHHLRQFNS